MRIDLGKPLSKGSLILLKGERNTGIINLFLFILFLKYQEKQMLFKQ